MPIASTQTQEGGCTPHWRRLFSALYTIYSETGALGHWSAGTLARWGTGTLGHWSTGALGHWSTGALGHWGTGELGNWRQTDSG